MCQESNFINKFSVIICALAGYQGGKVEIMIIL